MFAIDDTHLKPNACVTLLYRICYIFNIIVSITPCNRVVLAIYCIFDIYFNHERIDLWRDG